MIFEGDFGRDGAVCVRQAFSADEVALAARAIEANLAALSPGAPLDHRLFPILWSSEGA